MSLYRDSANLLIVIGAVDYYDLDATTKAPAPVDGATVTAKVYTPDRATQLGGTVTLTAEADQDQNTYRGILPSSVDLSDYETVMIRYEVNPGGAGDPLAIQVRWVEEEVLD